MEKTKLQLLCRMGVNVTEILALYLVNNSDPFTANVIKY